MALMMLKESMALHPSLSRRRDTGRFATGGYTLIDVFVFLVCLAVLGAMVVLPRIGRHRGRSPRINCTNNLKQLGLSYLQWAWDAQDRFPMQVSVTNGGSMEFVGSGAAWVHFRV